MNAEPRYQLDANVRPIWEAVAGSHSPGFADSYLYGAKLTARRLWPRTLTAWDALRSKCSKLLAHLEIELEKPNPFHESGQISVVDQMPQFFGSKHRER